MRFELASFGTQVVGEKLEGPSLPTFQKHHSRLGVPARVHGGEGHRFRKRETRLLGLLAKGVYLIERVCDCLEVHGPPVAQAPPALASMCRGPESREIRAQRAPTGSLWLFFRQLSVGLATAHSLRHNAALRLVGAYLFPLRMSDFLQKRRARQPFPSSRVLWALVALSTSSASGETKPSGAHLGAALTRPASLSHATRAKTRSLLGLSDGELKKLIENDVESLGSLSIGLPNNGRLFNGVRLEDSPLFEIVAPDFTWGTKETVEYLKVAAAEVHRLHKDTPPLHLGHISKKSGGYLSPHLSHQSGRDVDLGYFYSNKRAWYRRATWTNLDTARTWTFVKALIQKTDVELILIDTSIQSLLQKHAEQAGEDKGWLRNIFKGSAERPALIRHVRGHATHMHVRFFSPEAQRNAQRAYPLLIEQELIDPVVVYKHHTVRKGETLGRLAKMYGTTVPAIQQANGLRGTTIQAKRVYKIPIRGGPAPVPGPLIFPPRQLP